MGYTFFCTFERSLSVTCRTIPTRQLNRKFQHVHCEMHRCARPCTIRLIPVSNCLVHYLDHALSNSAHGGRTQPHSLLNNCEVHYTLFILPDVIVRFKRVHVPGYQPAAILLQRNNCIKRHAPGAATPPKDPHLLQGPYLRPRPCRRLRRPRPRPQPVHNLQERKLSLNMCCRHTLERAAVKP